MVLLKNAGCTWFLKVDENEDSKTNQQLSFLLGFLMDALICSTPDEPKSYLYEFCNM